MQTQLERRDATTDKRTILAVVGPLGAVHYWHEKSSLSGDFWRGKYGGVELHYRNPPDWADGRDPGTNDCWILGGPCWHDGSSLYADEVFIPLWERCQEMGDMEPFWRRLESVYRKRFESTTE